MAERQSLKRLRETEEEWFISSGVIELFKHAPRITERFKDTFGFDLRYYGTPPERLDGDKQKASTVAFYIVRQNRLMPERYYCLYVAVEGKNITARIGYIRDGNINTITELESLSEIKDPEGRLYNYLRALLKASCEKLS